MRERSGAGPRTPQAGAPWAAWNSRAIRRLAFFLCSTPLLAALSSVRSAARSASWSLAGSYEASASRAFYTADFTCVRTAWFRARRFSACRFLF